MTGGGQSSGYPTENEISYYNVDINTTNDVNNAHSISITQHYVQNTHLSIMTLAREYGIRIGRKSLLLG